MRKKLISLPLLSIIFASMLIFIPIQPVQAIGPGFFEGDDGFGLPTWTREITYINEMLGELFGFHLGDKFRFNITAMNNSQPGVFYISSPSSWIGDTIWATIEYYNTSTATWTNQGEQLLAAYNSTHPYYDCQGLLGAGRYYCYSYVFTGMLFGQNFPLIPLNFTAANHTIVNQTFDQIQLFSGFDFQYTTPSAPNVAGIWILTYRYTMMSVTYQVKYEYTFNDRGLMTKFSSYSRQVGSPYSLIYEDQIKIASSQESSSLDQLLLLLLLMSNNSGDGMIGLYIGLAIAIGIGGGIAIGLLIGMKKYKI
ncbi:MAG: hypothetical protein ACFFCM_05725 [Promethearchaeota archaeon]